MKRDHRMLQDNAQFDYVIAGAGAAGSVVANRLSENGKYRVCLIECGEADRNPFIHIPAGFIKTLTNPRLMWQFHSQPSEGSAGRKINLPQGRVLGGSTSINGLIYNRGQAQDFDLWASAGNSGWSYQDLLPYFKRVETRPGGDPEYRGTAGEMRISDPALRDPLCDAFINSVGSYGLPTHQDYNAGSQNGAGYYQRFIDGRRRISAATAFLKPVVPRKNLTICTGMRVEKILFDNKRATGLAYRLADAQGNGSGDIKSVSAHREVIISTGTVNSTRLLQLSGVANGDLLQTLGIPVVQPLPGVGENFQDHYFVRCAASLKDGQISLNQKARGWRLLSHVLRYAAGLPSIMTLSPSVAFAFLNSENFSGQPDLQFVFSPGSYKPGRVYELDNVPAITCGFTQQRPESKGFIRICSPDPDVPPLVQPNYLLAEADQKLVVKGIRLCRQFMQTAPLSDIIERESVPGGGVDSDADLLTFARETGNTGYHLVGTCTMGPSSNPQAVVSPSLKVHGVAGLRVIDASVMPNVTSSNTCAASLVIGEKGADMLLQDAHS